MAMRKSLRKIIYENFNITECVIYAQSYQSALRNFSTFGNPRKINGFIYLLNCDCTYELLSGTKLEAKKGDVIYLPAFGEYKSNFKNFGNEPIDGILINLSFSDDKGKPFYLPDKIKIYKNNNPNYIKSYFTNILNCSKQPLMNIAELKSIAYKILAYLGASNKELKINSSKYKCISEGISYLENDAQQILSIDEIAELCHVSATYFRRLFKEYSGVSPVQFRILKKLETAKALLSTNDMTIFEISDYLGFESVAYFSKLFKKHEKMSPSQYRNSSV